jgi:transposase
MTTATTPGPESTRNGATLYIGIELSAREWRLAGSPGMEVPGRQVVIRAGDRAHLREALARMKKGFRLPADAPVRSCYEAGRDGFWPHRLLETEGIQNVVVDSSSIEVSRRARRAKTDRLDADKLRRLLLRHALGERDVWHVVHVPARAIEAARQAPRILGMLIRERTRWRNRIHSLLATEQVKLRLDAALPTRLAEAVTWDGTPVPAARQARVLLTWRLLQTIEGELHAQRQAQHAATRAAATAAAAAVQQLTQLRGIGERFAWVLATEICSRDLQNRRQVGALTGFTGVPYQSGAMTHDQGISRSGLAAVRGLAIETAWVWVQWQPDSALTQWFQARFGTGSPRLRRVGIVALARRLVIALWRYSRDGLVPAGAVCKTVRA